MTKDIRKTALQARLRKKIHPTAWILSFFTLLTLAVLLRNSELAIQRMNGGLQLCVRTVIPSLFPFMVISEILVSGNVLHRLGRWLTHPCRRLLRLGPESACALLLGLLCGFPVGARGALSLYGKGTIDREELTRLLCFSNVPSSAFLISTVGVSLFGDRSFGILLYGVTLLSALLLGFALAHIFGHKKRTADLSASFSSDSSASVLRITTLTDAISSSALAMLQICAFVVFFSVFVGALEHLFVGLALPPVASALLLGFFEMTGGVSRAASLSPSVGEAVCAFLAGWSGISVHCQLVSLCPLPEGTLRPYLLSKFAHGCLNLLLFSLIRLLPLG